MFSVKLNKWTAVMIGSMGNARRLATGKGMRGFREVIAGIPYDTDNAELLATVVTGDEGEYADEIVHQLYRAVDGRWFLATSKEASESGEIVAPSVTEAAEWCRRHDLAPDVLARYF